MNIETLLKKKLLFVTGKGGTGKTVLAVALAHHLSQRGKKVWLVEIGLKHHREFSRLRDFLGAKSLGHEPTRVNYHGTEFLSSILDPTECLAEYAALKLPAGRLAKTLLNNRVTGSLLEVVPGLPDLVALGKIWFSLSSADSPLSIDTVVIDGPSTGHALAMLEAPLNFKKLTKVGPIYRDAAAMAEFLADKNLFSPVLASLPEEMPLQETLELTDMLKDKFPAGPVFANKCFPAAPKVTVPKNTDQAPWPAYLYYKRRNEREERALQGLPYTRIPFFFARAEEIPVLISARFAKGATDVA